MRAGSWRRAEWPDWPMRVPGSTAATTICRTWPGPRRCRTRRSRPCRARCERHCRSRRHPAVAGSRYPRRAGGATCRTPYRGRRCRRRTRRPSIGSRSDTCRPPSRNRPLDHGLPIRVFGQIEPVQHHHPRVFGVGRQVADAQFGAIAEADIGQLTIAERPANGVEVPGRAPRSIYGDRTGLAQALVGLLGDPLRGGVLLLRRVRRGIQVVFDRLGLGRAVDAADLPVPAGPTRPGRIVRSAWWQSCRSHVELLRELRGARYAWSTEVEHDRADVVAGLVACLRAKCSLICVPLGGQSSGTRKIAALQGLSAVLPGELHGRVTRWWSWCRLADVVVVDTPAMRLPTEQDDASQAEQGGGGNAMRVRWVMGCPSPRAGSSQGGAVDAQVGTVEDRRVVRRRPTPRRSPIPRAWRCDPAGTPAR